MNATTATSLRGHPWVLRWAGLLTRGRQAGDGVGCNRSPALAWSALPAQATHWLLPCKDPDVPMAHAITHLLAGGRARSTRCPKARGRLAPPA